MTTTSGPLTRRSSCVARSAALGALLAVLLAPALAGAWVDMSSPADNPAIRASGIFIVDGSYVMNVGELHINITNWGLIGSRFSSNNSFSDAPSAQWPAGSGDEYLWAAGIWIGGQTLGERKVSTGQFEYEILPLEEVEDTIYEAIANQLLRPGGNPDASGRRAPDPARDDDEDGEVDEETLNGYDDDEDGAVDEDFGQIGNQMMVCTMYDNTSLSEELWPDHSPLNIKVVQSSLAWEGDQVDDFVGFDYEVSNVGVADIDNVYIGFFADADIGPRGGGDIAGNDMAGSFDGLVQSSDGSYVPVAVGFMWDASEDIRLEGYFGIVFINHDTDPTGRSAPRRVQLRSFQRFSGQAPFENGGDPTNDSERYELLSEPARDGDVREGRQDDFRFLVSSGPFVELAPDETLKFQVAIVLGPGLIGMLSNAAEAWLTYQGNYLDEVGEVLNQEGDFISTGVNGRETKVCREDFPDNFADFYPDVMDATCADPLWVLTQNKVQDSDIFLDTETGKTCAYVNMDNCFECARQAHVGSGEPLQFEYCNGDNRWIEDRWNCWDPDVPDDQKAGCTGTGGRETQVTWLVGMAPPPPGLRLWPADNRVHVFWDNRSEVTTDLRSGLIDFESYRVWRADNWERPFGSSLENGPESNLWQLVAEFDLVNTYVNVWETNDGEAVTDTLPLGANTGLESIRYRPLVLDDPAYADLADSMQVAVDADVNGLYAERPPIYDRNGNINPAIPEVSAILPWQNEPAVLDTFWAVAEREGSINPPVTEKIATSYYEYVDFDSHNGFIYFYSVTATDHDLVSNVDEAPTIIGAGQSGDPGSSFENTVPGGVAQTAEDRANSGANIYVYPNPATRDALREFQQLLPDGSDPTGVRVVFTNLPQATNTIKIFTLSGDLVETLQHDGTNGYGQISWNLVSRNGQEIVSGIYLYSVEADDNRFEDFIGKFVVVR